MQSNTTVTQQLEQKLLECYGHTIQDLREHANRLGVELCIQSNGLWIHRPGYSKALRLDISTDPDDWRAGKIFKDLRDIADRLWANSDRLKHTS